MFWLLAALLQAVAPAPPTAASTEPVLDPRWAVELTAPPAQRAGYDDNTVYVATRDGALVAIDLDRGTVRWRREVAAAPPAVCVSWNRIRRVADAGGGGPRGIGENSAGCA